MLDVAIKKKNAEYCPMILRGRNHRFFKFMILSGLGWTLDLSVFILLNYFEVLRPFVVNYISTLFGITFVWFTSLSIVFKSNDVFRWGYLLSYWLFQSLSIAFYSGLLSLICDEMQSNANFLMVVGTTVILSKLIVTPFNLVTNFWFMKFLVRFMEKSNSRSSC